MKAASTGPFSLLRSTVNMLITNPIIFYPFFILAFIQLLILEVVYFAPRFPLSFLFGPIIERTAGSAFAHYPYNYLILSKWFHTSQIFIFLFISGIFYGATVLLIAAIHGGKEIKMKKIFGRAWSAYLHLTALMFLFFVVLELLSSGYGLIFKRALMIQSTAGIFFWIKKSVILAAPYFQLLFACFATALFAFVAPIILLEQKKFFTAVKLNFVNYRKSLGVIFGVMLLTGLLYLPVMLIKSTHMVEWALVAPEMSGILLVIGVVVMLVIDVLQWTAITLCYLLKKESTS